MGLTEGSATPSCSVTSSPGQEDHTLLRKAYRQHVRAVNDWFVQNEDRHVVEQPTAVVQRMRGYREDIRLLSRQWLSVIRYVPLTKSHH